MLNSKSKPTKIRECGVCGGLHWIPDPDRPGQLMENLEKHTAECPRATGTYEYVQGKRAGQVAACGNYKK
jgi:hypothetical protein